MSRGDELALSAMKKEHKRLCVLADKAKAEVDENINISSEIIAIHNEFCDIVKSKEHGDHILKKLEELKARRARADKILAKDLMTLLDKQVKAEMDRDDLGSQIQMLEWRIGRKSKTA